MTAYYSEEFNKCALREVKGYWAFPSVWQCLGRCELPPVFSGLTALYSGGWYCTAGKHRRKKLASLGGCAGHWLFPNVLAVVSAVSCF